MKDLYQRSTKSAAEKKTDIKAKVKELIALGNKMKGNFLT